MEPAIAVPAREGVDAALDPATSSRRGRRSIAVDGLVGIVIMFLAIGALWAMEQPPFIGADEKAHLGYAQAVAQGDLPAITDRPSVPASATQWTAELVASPLYRTRSVWVANHPPLPYVVTAPLIWWSDVTERPDGGLLLMRFANVAFGGVGIVLTYALARELTASRRLALLSAGFAAMTTQMFASTTLAMTDGFTFAAATAILWAGVRCLQRGPTTRDLGILALAVTVGAGARGVTMLMGFAVVAVVAAMQLRDPTIGVRDRWWQAVRGGIISAGPAVVAFGWFYIGNVVRYGDIGASSYLLERFDRDPNGSLVSMMVDVDVWRSLYVRSMSPATYGGAHPAMMPVALLGALGGLGVVVVTRRTGDRRNGGERYVVARRSLAMLAVAIGVIAVYIANHLSGGGYLHPRYAFPVLAAVATLFVIGLDRLVPRHLPALALVGMAAWTLTQIPVGVDPDRLRRPRDLGARAPTLLRVLPGHDFWRAFAACWIVVGCVIAGIALTMLVLAPQRFESGESVVAE